MNDLAWGCLLGLVVALVVGVFLWAFFEFLMVKRRPWNLLLFVQLVLTVGTLVNSGLVLFSYGIFICDTNLLAFKEHLSPEEGHRILQACGMELRVGILPLAATNFLWLVLCTAMFHSQWGRPTNKEKASPPAVGNPL